MKLKDILYEAKPSSPKKAKKSAAQPKPAAAGPTKAPVASPSFLGKGPEPDLDFLKHVQKGLSTVPPEQKPTTDADKIAQSVDKMIANFGKNHPQKTATAKKFPSPQDDEPKDKPIPSLSALAKEPDQPEDPLKDFPKFGDSEPDEHPFGTPTLHEPDPTKKDLDFLKHVQKGLSNVDSPVGQAADRITNKMYDKNRPEPKTVKGADKPPPSLASLAQGAEDSEDEKPQEDDLFKDFPKFSGADSEEWDSKPFGEPNLGKKPDLKTRIQQGTQALGQGLKKGVAALTQQPKQSDKIPANWKPSPSDSAEDETDDSPMPSMSSTAKQGMAAANWKTWKPGQKKDIGFVKDLEVIKVDQYGVRMKGKKGGIYRFIPHRGLRRIG